MNQNTRIRKSMEHALGVAIDQARNGHYSKAMTKDAYSNAVDEGKVDIFWEDYQKLCWFCYNVFIDNGGESE